MAYSELLRDPTIICGDALTEIAKLEDASFDLVFLDPNYDDWSTLLEQGLLNESLRVIKPTGNIICFTKQPFDFELRCAIQPYLRRQIVWSFSNGGAWCSPLLPLISHQMIYWASPNKKPFFQPRTGVQYAETTKSFKRSTKVFGDYEEEGKEFKMSDEGVWMRDHYHYNKPSSGNMFEKPEELIKVLLRCLCPPGGSILDPFGGSGVVMRQAATLNINTTTIEIDQTCVDKMREYVGSRLFL